MAPIELTRGVLVALLLGGCRGSQSALDPRGPQAEEIYDLWNVMHVGGWIVMALVLGLLAVALVLPARPAHDERHRLRWVLFGVVATIATVVGLLIFNTHTSRVLASEPAGAIEVEVVGHQWWWEVTYRDPGSNRPARTANELRIPIGRPVAIELTSRDVIHSFWVPNLHGKLDAIPGRTNRLWLQADEPGIYRGQCAEFCGLQHAKMGFIVVAVPPAEYDAWLENQRASARPPADAEAERGLAVFHETCAKCHAIRGTLAMASVAPDLTHLASRLTLGSGILPNRRGQLGGWITAPDHVKPGTYMPPIDLDADSLQALLRYLESLR